MGPKCGNFPRVPRKRSIPLGGKVLYEVPAPVQMNGIWGIWDKQGMCRQ